MFSIFATGLPWTLFYTSKKYVGKLNVYLVPHNPEETYWKIKTKFQITLLNQAGKDHRMSEIAYNDFSKAFSEGYGFPQLSLLKDLESAGFIKDNKIQLKVVLIAEKLHRNYPW